MADDEVTASLKTKNRRRFSSDMKGAAKDVRGVGDSAKKASREARALNRATRGLGGGLKNVGSMAAAGGAAIGIGLVVEAKRSIDAFQESRKVQADQAAALKSTGAQAWITAGQLDRQATALSRMAGMDDEAIAKAQTLMLTFRNVRNETGKGNDMFNRANQVVTDFSARFGKDLNSSAILVGKALNDPVKGLSALSRVGVTFDKQQKKQIETLTESGDRLGAQKLIMRELEAQTKGSAKAQATSLDRLKVTWENIEEELGRGASPAVDAIAGKLYDLGQRVLPMVGGAADDLARIMGRDDLSLGDKIRVGRRDVAGNFRPLIADIEREWDKLDVGDKLGNAVQKAAPQMADAMAAQVPRMMGAFARAFAEAGPGGQLLTLALITAKLGGFSAAGSWAARRFSQRFTATAASQSAAAMPTAMASGANSKRFSRAGSIAGKAVGVAATAAFVAELSFLGMDGILDALGVPKDSPIREELARGPLNVIGGTLTPESTSKEQDLTKDEKVANPGLSPAAAKAHDEARRKGQIGVGPVGSLKPTPPKARGSSRVRVPARRAGYAAPLDDRRPIVLVSQRGTLLAELRHEEANDRARRHGRER